MKTLVFLDDERDFEDVTWVEYPNFDSIITLRQYHEFESYIDNLVVKVGNLEGLYFSFDHDLGLEDFKWKQEFTGHDCAHYLLDVMQESKTNPNLVTTYVHSMNPVGKKNIEGLLESYRTFYNQYFI